MDNAPVFDTPGPVRRPPHPARRHRRLRHRRHRLPRPAARQLYFNQSGNGWGAGARARPFPAPSTTSPAPTVVDLLGNGTACLVWSSPLPGNARAPLRYIDLMGGQKPHLLVSVDEQPGRQTVDRLRAVDQVLRADKLAGTPWVTRLPFPVHVVERVETYDDVSRNLFVTRYAYHHGYYDGVEREFRGFGRVDQWDTEEFATLTGAPDIPAAVNLDAASARPAGADQDLVPHRRLLRRRPRSPRSAARVLREGDPPSERRTDRRSSTRLLLDDTVLPADILLPDGTRSPRLLARGVAGGLPGAARLGPAAGDLRAGRHRRGGPSLHACGAQLHDRGAAAQGPNQYGVFFAHPRETIDCQLRAPACTRSTARIGGARTPGSAAGGRPAGDARAHAGGRPVRQRRWKAPAIATGAAIRDPALSAADQASPGRHAEHVHCCNDYTERGRRRRRAPDATRARRPRTYELIQLAARREHSRRHRTCSRSPIVRQQTGRRRAATTSPTRTSAPTGLTAGPAYRRLIGQRTHLLPPRRSGRGRRRSPGAAADWAPLESLALPGATYKLAFTPGLITQVYQRGGAPLLPDPASVLGSTAADGGGYVDLDGDGSWWIPGGRDYYTPAPPTSPQELDAGAAALLPAPPVRGPVRQRHPSTTTPTTCSRRRPPTRPATRSRR